NRFVHAPTKPVTRESAPQPEESLRVEGRLCGPRDTFSGRGRDAGLWAASVGAPSPEASEGSMGRAGHAGPAADIRRGGALLDLLVRCRRRSGFGRWNLLGSRRCLRRRIRARSPQDQSVGDGEVVGPRELPRIASRAQIKDANFSLLKKVFQNIVEEYLSNAIPTVRWVVRR